jgi:hypothetical protein
MENNRIQCQINDRQGTKDRNRVLIKRRRRMERILSRENLSCWKYHCVGGFDIHPEMIMENPFFWDVTPYSLVKVDQCF